MCSYSYRFSPAINAYQAFGFSCNGNENRLSDCRGSGAVCQVDSAAHALAVECGGSSPRKFMHGSPIDLVFHSYSSLQWIWCMHWVAWQYWFMSKACDHT